MTGQTRRRSLTLKLTGLFAVLFLATSAAVITIAFAITDRTYSARRVRASTQELLESSGVRTPTASERDLITDLLGTDLRGVIDQAAGQARDDALQQLMTWSLVALAVSAAVFVPAAWWLAHRSLRPLRSMAATARSISATRLNARFRTEGPDDEVAQLATAFDETFDRIQRVFDAQRHFAAHASHELRTPLSTLRAEAELALSADASDATRQLAGAAIAAVERGDRLIAGLLALTRAESGAFERRPVSLAGLTGDVVGELADLADRRGITIELDLGRSASESTVLGERVLLETLVSNLVRNAIVHNVDHGSALVRVHGSCLAVENTGVEITDDDISRLVQPFSRADRSAREPGHGLGLTIVDTIAAAHDALVTRQPRPGGGLTTVVNFRQGSGEPD